MHTYWKCAYKFENSAWKISSCTVYNKKLTISNICTHKNNLWNKYNAIFIYNFFSPKNSLFYKWFFWSRSLTFYKIFKTVYFNVFYLLYLNYIIHRIKLIFFNSSLSSLVSWIILRFSLWTNRIHYFPSLKHLDEIVIITNIFTI